MTPEHLSNPDAIPENYAESVEEATITNINHNGVLKRVTHTTPSLVRKRPGTSAPAPVSTVNATQLRSKNMKKHRQPTIEKTSRIKLQLGSTVKPESTTVKAKKNVDINGNINRYSFVSDDHKQVNNFSVTSNSSVLLGEAEVIIIPSTAVGEYSERYEDVTSEGPKTKLAHIQMVEQISSRNNGKVTSESNERKIEQHETDASINEAENRPIPITDNSTNLSVNVPTRSNIGLNRPRPKPVLQNNQTITNATTDEKTQKTQIDQTTEDNVIVLNTEVVTSTSMQVSYGNNVILEETLDPKNDDDGDNITHNVPSLFELSGSKTQQKYKNIFPRSIRDEEQTDRNKETKMSAHLNLIIEKYKKQPSNETLQLIIEQLAVMYTKATTPATQTTKLNLLKPSYSGMMLIKPLNKIYNVTTTTPVPKPGKYPRFTIRQFIHVLTNLISQYVRVIRRNNARMDNASPNIYGVTSSPTVMMAPMKKTAVAPTT